jgi:hypothetical protein
MKYAIHIVVVTVKVSGASTQIFKDTLRIGVLPFDSTQNVTVTLHCNLSASGTHIFKAYTAVAGDVIATNDTLAAVNITVNPLPPTPVITAHDTLTFCHGDSVLLVSSTASGNVWTGGSTNDSLVVKTSGKYVVKVTVGGCSATSDTTRITVNQFPAVPVITAHGPTTFCQGGQVILTTGSTTGNVWTGGIANDSLTVTASGSYSVILTVHGCSTTSLPKVITVNPLPPTPTITAHDTTTFCHGHHVILTSSSTTGNVWTGGSTNDSLTVTTSGSYSVTVTVTGCSTTSIAKIVTVNTLPTVSLTPFTTTPCAQDLAFALSGGSPAGGVYSGIGVSAGYFHPNQAGHVQGITYTFTDTHGCSNSASENITVLACTGVEENSALHEVSVYPNPSRNGIINIVIKNANFNQLMLNIVDIQGREVCKTSDKNIQQLADYSKQINIANLAKGIYFIKLTMGADSGQVVKTQKLIID